MPLQKKRKKSRFLGFSKKRKKRILELWLERVYRRPFQIANATAIDGIGDVYYTNKKAVLSQRWPRNAPHMSDLYGLLCL